MSSTPQKSFDVSSSGSTVLYFSGYPQYDAFRVEFDGGSSGSASTDVTFKIDSESQEDKVEADGFASMDATVESATGVDASSGAHVGTDAAGRTVAVEINETGGSSNAAGTVYVHQESDSAQNGSAFASR